MPQTDILQFVSCFNFDSSTAFVVKPMAPIVNLVPQVCMILCHVADLFPGLLYRSTCHHFLVVEIAYTLTTNIHLKHLSVLLVDPLAPFQ